MEWQKCPPDRHSDRRLTKYVFKENDTEVGFFQIKGTLNRQITGSLFEASFQFKDEVLPGSKWYNKVLDTAITRSDSTVPAGRITGRRIFWIFEKPVHQFIITVREKDYLYEVKKNQISVCSRGSGNPVLTCSSPKTAKGEILYLPQIDAGVFLASFYIIHQYMDNKESSIG